MKRVGILVILAISVYGLAWTAVYATADRSAVQFRMDGGQSSFYPNVPLQGLFPGPGPDGTPLVLVVMIVSAVAVAASVRRLLRFR